MEHFLSHIGYIIIVAFFVALLGIGMTVFARMSQKENEKHGYDPAWDKSDLACAGCKFFGVCSGMSAMRPDVAPSEESACGKTPVNTNN